MSKWAVKKEDVDGVSYDICATLEEAAAEMVDYLGTISIQDVMTGGRRSGVGTFGNTSSITEVHDDMTSEAMNDLRRAYDARECGTATQQQLALLEKFGY